MMRFLIALLALLFASQILGGTPLARALVATIITADRIGFVLAGLVLAAAVAVVCRGVLTPGSAVTR